MLEAVTTAFDGLDSIIAVILVSGKDIDILLGCDVIGGVGKAELDRCKLEGFIRGTSVCVDEVDNKTEDG